MPNAIRLYTPCLMTAPGEVIPLTENQFHYLKNVMRLSNGGVVRLFNVSSGEWAARVYFLKKSATATTHQCLRPSNPPRSQRWLAISPLRPHLLSLVIEKATELGVTGIQPLITAHTQPHSLRIDKWQRVAIEAAEQSERLDIPEILPPRPIAAFCKAMPSSCIWFAAIERANAPHLLAKSTGCPNSGVIIGPEGGFANDETEQLASAPAIQCVSLGPNILRAETAAIYSLSILQANALSTGANA